MMRHEFHQFCFASIFMLMIGSSLGQSGRNSTTTTTIQESNVTSTHDLEDPLYCSAFTWNHGWIAVATNAFPTSSACCGRRVMGWVLHDDILKDLKGKSDAPPYCFYTKRLGSALTMKTLIATKCGLTTRLRCGHNTRFRCNYSTHQCVPLRMSDPVPSRRRPFLPADFAEIPPDPDTFSNTTRDAPDLDYY